MKRKFVIITGASRGIGKAVAHYFAKQHYDLALVARDETKLLALKNNLQDHYPGINIDVFAVDVGNIQEVQQFLENLMRSQSHIDVLFNNAGIVIDGTSELSVTDFQKMIDVNLTGAFTLATTVAKKMIQQRQGYIFNMASMSSKRGTSFLGGYCASKFGLLGFSESLMKELAPHNVKVTALCPGTVATEMTQRVKLDDQDKIQTDDIVLTIDYLLKLKPSATVSEVQIQCTKMIADETTKIMQYLKK